MNKETFEIRPYQIEAQNALLRDIEQFNPVIAVPTGAGKTVIMSGFIFRYLEMNPGHNVLVLCNFENILLQNKKCIEKFFPDTEIGLYSSGLKSKTIKKITVAGIQSVFRKSEEFKHFEIVIIDECHAIPRSTKSMYMSFFNKLDNPKFIGLSATVFRSKSSFVYEGKGALFNKLSYDITSREAFNRLIKDGYLCDLISRATHLEMNIDGVKTTAGDYNKKALSEKFDREGITKKAVAELIQIGQHNYKKWLVFAIDIEHANHITKELNKNNVSAMALHSNTEGDRTEITNSFINGEIRALVSVGMVTTGFDVPNIDLIVLLRPTKSPVLHIQMIGRGLRVHPNKKHCLVLDFAGNISRLGPINDPVVKKYKKGKGGKNHGPPVKKCPKCLVLNPISVKNCNICGHIFESNEKITSKPGKKEVITKGPSSKWLKVDTVSYKIHKKVNSPDSFRVTYLCGIISVNEYICLDHTGYAKHKAEFWVSRRFDYEAKSMPKSVYELHVVRKYLRIPTEIKVSQNGVYLNVLDYRF